MSRDDDVDDDGANIETVAFHFAVTVAAPPPPMDKHNLMDFCTAAKTDVSSCAEAIETEIQRTV